MLQRFQELNGVRKEFFPFAFGGYGVREVKMCFIIKK